MGEVIDLISEAAVDTAWEELRAHSARLLDSPDLLLDRPFMERQARLFHRFERLFMAMENRS